MSKGSVAVVVPLKEWLSLSATTVACSSSGMHRALWESPPNRMASVWASWKFFFTYDIKLQFAPKQAPPLWICGCNSHAMCRSSTPVFLVFQVFRFPLCDDVWHWPVMVLWIEYFPLQTEASLAKARATWIYGYNCNYLEGSLTTHPFSNTVIVGSPWALWCPQLWAFDQEYISRDWFFLWSGSQI